MSLSAALATRYLAERAAAQEYGDLSDEELDAVDAADVDFAEKCKLVWMTANSKVARKNWQRCKMGDGPPCGCPTKHAAEHFGDAAVQTHIKKTYAELRKGQGWSFDSLPVKVRDELPKYLCRASSTYMTCLDGILQLQGGTPGADGRCFCLLCVHQHLLVCKHKQSVRKREAPALECR